MNEKGLTLNEDNQVSRLCQTALDKEVQLVSILYAIRIMVKAKRGNLRGSVVQLIQMQ